MPQLNPSPWLFIFLLSWSMLLLVLKTKTLQLTPHNTPSLPNQQTLATAPWNWPWI
uniref:ATP synthase complex subunit 8 n=1 Tax=Dibamus novaeguineae TaxID=266055 RepID=C6FGQ9_9SAUR|nr:ATP synthase F0 subunit 8 [Dibamus novaeguineae]